VDRHRQERYKQFFTPSLAADIIASMPLLPTSGSLRVLDPGAGVGSLTAALVERVRREAPQLKVHLVASEIDHEMIGDLGCTLADVATDGTTYEVHHGDFLLDALGPFAAPAFTEPFDLVIMNPPYGLLGARDLHRQAVQQAGVDCPNLYAAFVAISHRLLSPGGQIVAIIPRSFANGPYYEPFRRDLLDAVAINGLHEFGSRSTVFADTGVLQETVIVSCTKGGARKSVRINLSTGHTDEIDSRVVPYEAVVRPDDPHRFVRIPGVIVPPADASTLPQLGLKASTGKVVDFRSRERLVAAHTDGSVPLIYPANLRGGEVLWPREIRKAQGFLVDREDADKFLMPAGVYVLTKRFSAKEERRRVVAVVCESDSPIAFENHLNVIHHAGHGLERDVAVGLSLWLNSTPLDLLFREFSGHTQVNATDLRTLPIPPLDTLRHWGHGRPFALPSQQEIDQLVAD
jgi:adenine-specific DNA-methyltransferase